MKIKHQEERARYSSWRKDLEEVEKRVKSRQLSEEKQYYEASLSRSAHQRSLASLANTINRDSVVSQEEQLEHQIIKIEEKLKHGVARAQRLR